MESKNQSSNYLEDKHLQYKNLKDLSLLQQKISAIIEVALNWEQAANRNKSIQMNALRNISNENETFKNKFRLTLESHGFEKENIIGQKFPMIKSEQHQSDFLSDEHKIDNCFQLRQKMGTQVFQIKQQTFDDIFSGDSQNHSKFFMKQDNKQKLEDKMMKSQVNQLCKLQYTQKPQRNRYKVNETKHKKLIRKSQNN